MKKFFCLLQAVILVSACGATAIHITLPKAIREGDLLVSVHANGGYCEKNGLQLDVRNISCRDYIVDVSPALIFRPDDESYQPLVIAGIPSLEIKSETRQSIALQTFCGHSSASSPLAGLRYTFYRQGDSALTRVVRFINAKGYYDHLGQSAVWAITDNHPANAVYDASRPQASREFAGFVATQKGEAAPGWYGIYKVNNIPGRPVFFPGLQQVVVDLDWKGESPRNVHYSVFRPDGTVYRRVAGTEHIGSDGSHRLHTVFNTKKTPQGIYYVRVYNDENYTLQQQEVHIE